MISPLQWYTKISCLLLILTLGLAAPLTNIAHAERFYAIVVADVSPSAGWGKVAGTIQMDAMQIWLEVNSQVPESQLEYYSLIITDDENSTPETIMSVLKEISPKPEDTLFFYFSGHGARDDQGQFLKLAKGKIYRQQIIDTMASKKARFNVLITDCCNMRSDGMGTSAPFMMPDEIKTISPLFRSLFFSHKGWVDINSSRPGEAAFIQIAKVPSSTRPSIFTASLAAFLNKNRQKKASWDQLVREVSLDVTSSFHANYPKGATVAKGLAVQLEQNVYAITYPGMPESSGPRSGITARDQAGGGVYVTAIGAGMPANRVFDLRSKKYESMKLGQIITHVNNQPVKDSQHFATLVKESPQMMRLTLKEKNSSRELLLRLRY